MKIEKYCVDLMVYPPVGYRLDFLVTLWGLLLVPNIIRVVLLSSWLMSRWGMDSVEWLTRNWVGCDPSNYLNIKSRLNRQSYHQLRVLMVCLTDRWHTRLTGHPTWCRRDTQLSMCHLPISPSYDSRAKHDKPMEWCFPPFTDLRWKKQLHWL